MISRQHGGETVAENLALACLRCNGHKGPNISSIDSLGRGLTRLYHPRHDRWAEHFAWNVPILIGLTALGRATIRVLSINNETAVAVRRILIAEGAYPPR